MTRLALGSLNVAGPYFHARGEGLTLVELDEATGTLHRVAVVPGGPNTVALLAHDGWLYAGSEKYFDAGEVVAYRLEGGTLVEAGRVTASTGGGLCDLEVAGGSLWVCSYFGGVTVHPLNHGVPAPLIRDLRYPGHGVDAERQDRSHPHQATRGPDGRVWVCDLGTDTIWVHRNLDTPPESHRLPPGTGPRQLVLADRTWVLGELDGRLHALGGFEPVSVRPDGDAQPPAAASLVAHPTGRTLVATNRGSDTAAVFQDGALAAMVTLPGAWPRDAAFSPSGRWLVVALQNAHRVVALGFDPATGLPTGEVGAALDCGSPMAVTFLPPA